MIEVMLVAGGTQERSCLPPEPETGTQSPRKRRRTDDSEDLLAEMQPRAKQLLLSHDGEDCPGQLQQPEDCSKHSSGVTMQRPQVQQLKDAGDGLTHSQHVPGDTKASVMCSQALCSIVQSIPKAMPVVEAAGTLKLQPLDDSVLNVFSSEMATPRPEYASSDEPQIRAAASEEAMQASPAAIAVANPKDAACRDPKQQARVSKHMPQTGHAGRASMDRAHAGRVMTTETPARHAYDRAEPGVTGNRAASDDPAGGHLGAAGEAWQMKEEVFPANWVPYAKPTNLRNDKAREQSGRCARHWTRCVHRSVPGGDAAVMIELHLHLPRVLWEGCQGDMLTCRSMSA